MTTALIVGGDGRIGLAAAQALRKIGMTVVATTRRKDAVGVNRPYLDLASEPETWPRLRGDICLIAAAVTSLDACRKCPRETSKINFAGAVEMARRIVGADTFALFLSSNQVFDGRVPYRQPSDEPCPASEYGRQKAAAEAGVLRFGKGAAVLRLTKVLAPDLPLLVGWVNAFMARTPVPAFGDMKLAPLTIQMTVEAIIRIFSMRAAGIHHLSGDVDMTYADVARRMSHRFACDERLVQSKNAAAAGLDASMLPAHTVLACPTLATLGMKQPKSEDAVSQCIEGLFSGRSELRTAGVAQ